MSILSTPTRSETSLEEPLAPVHGKAVGMDREVSFKRNRAIEASMVMVVEALV